MSDVIDKAVVALAEKMPSGFSGGAAKFVITDEGCIMVDGQGVRAGDEEADVTMTASADVFAAILDGSMNATSAFMTGKLTVDGNMGLAMMLGSALS